MQITELIMTKVVADPGKIIVSKEVELDELSGVEVPVNYASEFYLPESDPISNYEEITMEELELLLKARQDARKKAAEELVAVKKEEVSEEITE